MAKLSGTALKDSVRIATHFSDLEAIYASSNSLRYDVIVDIAPDVKWVPENGYLVEIDNDIDSQSAFEQELRRRHKFLGAMRFVVDRPLQDESTAQKIPSAESKGVIIYDRLSGKFTFKRH